MFLSLIRSVRPVGSQPEIQRNAEGIITVDDPTKAGQFYEEDMLFCGVPIGAMTYGYRKLSEKTLRGIKSIGRFCSIAEDVSVVGMHHPTDWVSTNPFLYRTDRTVTSEHVSLPKKYRLRNQPVEIGHDVWIGEGVRILRPVKLGHGCVIAAGSVVTKDIPPYAIAAGVPARVLRYRIDERLIPAMLAIAWWNWPLPTIRERLDVFYTPEKFVERFSPANPPEPDANPAQPSAVKSPARSPSRAVPLNEPGTICRLPDFLIVGGMKCGTSSIGHNLHGHPNIHMARGGYEVHFFDRTINFNQGLDWYRAHFPEQAGVTAYGDKTPTYIDIKNLDRIHATLPSAKLIMIMRDPVSRFQSHYNYTQRPKVKDQVREAHAREFKIDHLTDPSFDLRILDRGFYANQLEHVFRLFPREQVHVAFLEDFKSDEREAYNRILDFIGVERVPIELKRFNEQGTYLFPFSEKAKRDLFEIYEPHNKRLFALLGREQPSWMSYSRR